MALAAPALELLAAVLLIPASTARAGAGIALGLLLAFSLAVHGALARGLAPDCHCLGQIGGGPVGAGTLARNFGLALLAGFVLVV